MSEWLLQRLLEESTLYGLPAVILVAVGAWLLLRHLGVHLQPEHALVPVLAAVQTVLTPNSAYSRIFGPVVDFWLKAFSTSSEPPPLSALPSTKGTATMRSSIFAEITADAPDLLSVLEDGLALAKQAEADLAGKTPLQMIGALSQLAPAAEKFSADLAKVIADIKAAGAAEAAAAAPPAAPVPAPEPVAAPVPNPPLMMPSS